MVLLLVLFFLKKKWKHAISREHSKGNMEFQGSTESEIRQECIPEVFCKREKRDYSSREFSRKIK